MQTRPTIDLARGVLMASFNLTAQEAWTTLVMVSQQANTKLHRLAEDLVNAVNGPPLPAPLQDQLNAAITQLTGPTPDTAPEQVGEPTRATSHHVTSRPDSPTR